MDARAALAGDAGQDGLTKGVEAFWAGDLAAAMAILQAHVMASPADADARYWLYSAAAAAGAEQASMLLAEARSIHAHSQLISGGVDPARLRTDKAYAAQVGTNCYANKLMAAASECFGRALDFDALDPNVMLSYGLSLQHQGRLNEAVDVFQAASEVFQIPALHQFLIYPLI